jgi:hypothetical protein
MPMPKKRSEDKLGHPATAQSAQLPIEKIEFEQALEPPDPDPGWKPIALYAYRAFLNSPLSQFYTETDLAYGWMTAEAIDTAIKSGMSAMRVVAADSMMRAALFTETDRRKVRIELTRKEPETNPTVDANVADFEARRAARAQR